MALRLTAIIAGTEHRLSLPNGVHELGSSVKADLRLPQSTVSRQHAQIEVNGNDARIKDLGSRNGTAVNGRVISGWREIFPGDTLRFGQVSAKITLLDDAELVAAVPGDEPPAQDQTPPPAATLATHLMSGFASRFLPRLLEQLTRPDCDPLKLAGKIVQFLARSTQSEVQILREDGIVARSSESMEQAQVSHQRSNWQIDFCDIDPEQRPAYDELARVALDLLLIAARLEGTGDNPPLSDAKSGPDSPGLAVAPMPPDPATGHQGLREIYRQAASVAQGQISVLIEGESGTGKELLARYIHEGAGNHQAPLVVINCASLPRDLLEAELFGIEKGVATGVDARAGKFELADGGTLFLDEIGDMAADTQARILRTLQEREVTRVGGHTPRPANVRVISATNRPMEEMVKEGSFRRDLYHRIADWTVKLPALRERRMDVPNLAAHFLRRACGEAGRSFGGLSEGAVSTLLSYSWPGNVRELEREMQRCALFLGDGEMLASEMLQDRIRNPGAEDSGDGLEGELARSERVAIRRALDASGGKVAEAAEMLGIGRSTLYRRIKELDLDAN